MVTTIQISKRLQEELSRKKMFDRETYEEIIWDLLEDSRELSEEAKKELAIARQEILSGKSNTISQLKKELKF